MKNVRESIIEKMNATPQKNLIAFTNEETNFIVKQWIEEKFKRPIAEAKPYHYIQENKDKAGYRIKF
jgi:hypothetical protein